MRHYPEAEEYKFPRNSIEQAHEELRLYPDGKSFRRNLIGLRHMYGATAFVGSMQRYASYAAAVKGEESHDQHRMNLDFYSGALMAVHVNVTPLLPVAKRAILLFSPLGHIEKSSESYTREENNIRDWMIDWTGGEDDEETWYGFMSDQDAAYQEVATQMAERLLEGRLNSYEREVDFMSGFAFASNLVWQVHSNANIGPPV